MKGVKTVLASMAAVASLSPMTMTVHAFVSPNHSVAKVTSLKHPSIYTSNHIKQTTTSLKMGYQLPPSGPKGPLDEIKALLPTIGTGILVVLFFASPLGGAFFAVFNSLFVLALLTPLILFVGFQVWSSLYTVEAPCPSCGKLPIRALKDGQPTVCLSCGAYSRANADGNGLELCNNPNDVMGGSLFDSLFGMGGNGMSDMGTSTRVEEFDVFGTTSTVNKDSSEDKVKKAKQQGNIIDVDVERD